MTVPSKRAKYVALTSLITSGIFFIATFIIGRWSGYNAVSILSWFILSPALISFALLIWFHQRALAEQEKLDLEQAQRDEEEDTTIFQQEGRGYSELATAQQRLELLEKWFIPIFSGLIAVYQFGIGLYLFTGTEIDTEMPTRQPLVAAILLVAVAFVSFLISRYATGMSAEPAWKPLRAAGSALLGISIMSFLVTIALALAHFGYPVPVLYASYVVAGILVILGLETALNVIMDIYRPRLSGQYSRPPFDSRLLGLLSEPGGVFRTAAGAIDYQFGFQVSQTWFYQLLERAVVPLFLFGAIVLYLMSSVVVLGPNEQGIVEHFGRPVQDDGQVRIIGPGMTIKWPWPIDVVRKYPTKKISEINLSFTPAEPDELTFGPLLWGEEHYEEEHTFLVATQVEGRGERSIPVSFVKAAVPVQYTVTDPYAFLYNHEDTEKTLEAIAYRQLTEFAASAKLEVEDAPGTEVWRESLLGAGRSHAKEVLTERIQAAADAAELGVEIIFVGLQSIHPPVEVAADYQRVVGAVQLQQAEILDAHAHRNRELGELLGDADDADRIYDLVQEYNVARDEEDEERRLAIVDELEAAFTDARGEVFKILRDAQSYSLTQISLAHATGERFVGQLKAYNALPDYYLRDQRLKVFEQALTNTRKYVIVADPEDRQVFIVDVMEQLTPDLYEIGGFQETR